MKKTELWVAIVGLVGSLLTVIMESAIIPPGSLVYVILGGLATVISYITGRSYVKGQEAKERAVVKASELASIRTVLNVKPPTNDG